MRVALEQFEPVEPDELHLQVGDEQLAVDTVAERERERVEGSELRQEAVDGGLQGCGAGWRLVTKPAVELVEPAAGGIRRVEFPVGAKGRAAEQVEPARL